MGSKDACLVGKSAPEGFSGAAAQNGSDTECSATGFSAVSVEATCSTDAAAMDAGARVVLDCGAVTSMTKAAAVPGAGPTQPTELTAVAFEVRDYES